MGNGTSEDVILTGAELGRFKMLFSLDGEDNVFLVGGERD